MGKSSNAWVAFVGALLFGAVGCSDAGEGDPSQQAESDVTGVTIADGGTSTGFVTSSGGHLYLDGKRFRFIGANRYDVSSFPPGSGKYRCGAAFTDTQLDQLLSELVATTGATVIRFWAFQSFTMGGTDWSSLDRVIATAKRHGLRVIMTLENEWTACTQRDPSTTDGRKGGSWYASGYLSPTGTYRLSYRDYVKAIVTRYKDEPGIAMWQLMNEAESTDPAALLSFTQAMAQVVKGIDARHLLSLGTMGGGQHGTQGSQYTQLHAVSGIDVVEGHDYNHEAQPIPGSPSSTSNTIYADIQTARALGKPFFLGEVGIQAPSPTYTYSFAQRASLFDAKISANWAAGTDGFLVWSFYDLTLPTTSYKFAGNDPLAPVLKKYAAMTPP